MKKTDPTKKFALLHRDELAKSAEYWVVLYEYGEVIPCKIKRDRVEVCRTRHSSQVQIINHLKNIVAFWHGSKLQMVLPACEIYNSREEASSRLESYVKMRQQEIMSRYDSKEVLLDQMCLYFAMHAASQQTAYSRSLKDLVRRFFNTDVMRNLDDSDSSHPPVSLELK